MQSVPHPPRLTLLNPLSLLQHLLAAHCRRILFSQSIRRSTNNNNDHNGSSSNTNENSFSAATALPQSLLPLPLFKEQCNLVERPFIHIAHAHTHTTHTHSHTLTHTAPNSRRRVAWCRNANARETLGCCVRSLSTNLSLSLRPYLSHW